MGSSYAIVFVLVAVSGPTLGASLAWFYASNYASRRYTGPQLHDGRWLRGERRAPGKRFDDVIWDKDGVPWYLSDVPKPNHRCRAQTCTLTDSLIHEDRCACGAARYGVFGDWVGVNVRWEQQQRI